MRIRPRIFILSTLLGCASTGEARLTATPAGPPILKFEGALPPRFTPEVIEIDALESWREAGERLVMIDGKEVWALSRFTILDASGAETERRIGAGHLSAGAEATEALLEKLGVEVPTGRRLRGPKLRATQLGEEKVHWLWTCDDECLKSLYAQLGATYDRDKVKEAWIDRWQQASTKAADEAALARLDGRFLDLDPSAWHQDGPWWANVTTASVPYIDGEQVLIATASDDSSPSEVRRLKAEETARVALARFIGTQMGRDAGLTETQISAMAQYARVALLDRRGSASALAICDPHCVKNSALALGINLSSDASAARE